MKQEYLEKIAEADLVLVGIGAEFETVKLRKEDRAVEALRELAGVLKGKNYFIITTCTNSILSGGIFDEERIVSPCGTLEKKQCPKHCEGSLQLVTNEEQQRLQQAAITENVHLGVCTACGEKLVLNNVYAEKYDEAGYLEAWGRYTKWLQGTLNKQLLILELGVDMAFANIIRWPFEKVGFYNQKATFIRVNEKLYYMSEELKDKGIPIGENAIGWLLDKEI